MRGHCSCAGVRYQRAHFRPSLSEIVCLLPPLVSPLPSPPPSSLSPIFYFLFNYYNSGFNPPDNVRTTALINALAEILWQAGGSKCAKLVLYVARREFFNIIILIVYLSFIFIISCLFIVISFRNPANPKRFKAYKLVDWTAASFSTATELQQAIRTNISSFTGLISFFFSFFLFFLISFFFADSVSNLERSGCGVLLFVYSAILTRGISNVRSDMDVSDTPLLAPHVSFFSLSSLPLLSSILTHSLTRTKKYCSQELVNLMTTGRATSNVFDGTMNLEGNILKGIANRGTIGLLTLMEKMGYCQVGNHLKSPVYPVSFLLFLFLSALILNIFLIKD